MRRLYQLPDHLNCNQPLGASLCIEPSADGNLEIALQERSLTADYQLSNTLSHRRTFDSTLEQIEAEEYVATIQAQLQAAEALHNSSALDLAAE